MSIVLPRGLPAASRLHDEGFAVEHAVDGGAALRVVLVNLMPDRIATETQFARLLAASRHRVALSLSLPDGMVPREAEAAHHAAFYRPWAAIEAEGADAVIVTGAPVERHPFEEVRYWAGVGRVLDWSRAHLIPSYLVCWAAQAALWRHHEVPKHDLPEKAFGVFPQAVRLPASPILHGVGPALLTLVSRHTGVRRSALAGRAGLSILAQSPETGPCMVEDRAARAVYVMNHLEYDADTLGREYVRDIAAGRPVRLPAGYFPRNDPSATPVPYWRPQAVRVFQNWLEQVAASRETPLQAGAEKNSCMARSMKATSLGRRNDAAM